MIWWNLTLGYLTSLATICSYTQISSSREQVAVDSVAVVQVPPNHQLHHHYFRHHHTITIIWVTIIYLLHHSPRTVIMFTKSSSPGKYRDQTWPAVGCWSQDFCSSYWACHHFQKVNRKQSHLNHWDYQSYQHKITIGIAQACPVGNGDSLFKTGINSNLSRSEDFVATTTWGGRDVLYEYFNSIKNKKQYKSSEVTPFIS